MNAKGPSILSVACVLKQQGVHASYSHLVLSLADVLLHADAFVAAPLVGLVCEQIQLDLLFSLECLSNIKDVCEYKRHGRVVLLGSFTAYACVWMDSTVYQSHIPIQGSFEARHVAGMQRPWHKYLSRFHLCIDFPVN